MIWCTHMNAPSSKNQINIVRKKVFPRKKYQSIIPPQKFRVITLIHSTLIKWDFSENGGEKYHWSIIKWGEVSSKWGVASTKHADVLLKTHGKIDKKNSFLGNKCTFPALREWAHGKWKEILPKNFQELGHFCPTTTGILSHCTGCVYSTPRSH